VIGGRSPISPRRNSDGRRLRLRIRMTTKHNEEFVSEAMTPVAGTGDAGAMARGEPGIPSRFTWRDTEYSLVGVMETWKTSSPCKHGGGEVYLRRHWYRILTDPPAVMTVYCTRQAPRSNTRNRPKPRWWIYTVAPADPPPEPPRSEPAS